MEEGMKDDGQITSNMLIIFDRAKKENECIWGSKNEWVYSEKQNWPEIVAIIVLKQFYIIT